VTEAIASLDPAAVAAAVDPGEYRRLLGMPREGPLEGLLAERADWARAWYAEHGRPYRAARRHDLTVIDDQGVTLADGTRLQGKALVHHLRRYDCHGLVGVAVTAGPEVDRACAALWAEDRPDEAYFLERFGVAVVERLIFAATLEGCQTAESARETWTPHLSPGCGDWELAQQHTLWRAIFPDRSLGPIDLLPSGGLHPKNSLLAAAGITRGTVAPSPLDACRSCRLDRCRFRRAAYRGPG